MVFVYAQYRMDILNQALHFQFLVVDEAGMQSLILHILSEPLVHVASQKCVVLKTVASRKCRLASC